MTLQDFARATLDVIREYSTGETGLMLPEEFARLDFSRFVDLQAMAEKAKAAP